MAFTCATSETLMRTFVLFLSIGLLVCTPNLSCCQRHSSSPLTWSIVTFRSSTWWRATYNSWVWQRFSSQPSMKKFIHQTSRISSIWRTILTQGRRFWEWSRASFSICSSKSSRPVPIVSLSAMERLHKLTLWLPSWLSTCLSLLFWTRKWINTSPVYWLQRLFMLQCASNCQIRVRDFRFSNRFGAVIWSITLATLTRTWSTAPRITSN